MNNGYLLLASPTSQRANQQSTEWRNEPTKWLKVTGFTTRKRIEQKHTMLNIPEVEHHRVKHSWLNGGARLCKWIHANEMVIVPNLKLKRCLISNLYRPSFVGRTAEMMWFEWLFHATGYRSAYIVSGLTEWENNYRVCEACSPQTKPVMIEKNRSNEDKCVCPEMNAAYFCQVTKKIGQCHDKIEWSNEQWPIFMIGVHRR